MPTARATLAFLFRWTIVGLAVACVIILARLRVAAPEKAVPTPVAVTEPAAHAPAIENSFADAVARAGPAVVNIYTTRVLTERILPPEFDKYFQDQPPVRQQVQGSLGSGVIVDAEGHVVTNNHVIAQAQEIRLQLADGRVTAVTIVGTDPDTDIAILRINLKPIPVMPIGRSDELRVGDTVLAIGSPFGLSQTVTHGIVSATGRGQLGLTTFENFIQTDAAINLGNSGGALINVRGELIGINTAALSSASGIEGIGFAIPVNLVRGVMQQIIRYGRVRRGYLGVTPRVPVRGQDEPNEPRAQGAPQGVQLAQVDAGGPAGRAGMHAGDIITAINGEPVYTFFDARARIASMEPGATVKIAALRGRKAFEVTVTVEERPPTPVAR
jgi:Do/DeqQ family serine protease